MSRLWNVGLFVKDKDCLGKAFEFTNNLIKYRNEEVINITKGWHNFRIETNKSLYTCLIANESIRGYAWHEVFIFNAELIDNAIIGWYIISRIYPYDGNVGDSWNYEDYVHYVNFDKSKFEMNNGVCDKCIIAKGVKFFECLKCDKNSGNYINGVSLCYDCCKECNICVICGKEFKLKDEF